MTEKQFSEVQAMYKKVVIFLFVIAWAAIGTCMSAGELARKVAP